MVVMPMATAMTMNPQISTSRASLCLKGEGVLAFLHNILTCNVLELEAGKTAYGALLSPQGKILHDMFVTNSDTKIWINCAASGRDDLITKLKLYRLRAKFEIEPIELAPKPIDPRHDDLARLEIFSEAYEDARYELGIANSAEIGVGKLFPHEANYDQFSGVDFKKGCYIGQEVVSRMHHRNITRNRILPITFENDQHTDETEIRSNETLIGEVLGRRGKLGLGLIRLDRLAEATAPLRVQNQNVSVKQ
jgi:tRNA-modifying protein YgfZ